MTFLEDYDFELEHLLGHTNTVANFLFRRSDLSEGVKINNSAIVLPEHLFSHKISVAKQDHARKTYLEDNLHTRRKILQEIHDSPTGGHPGISNTWHLINHQLGLATVSVPHGLNGSVIRLTDPSRSGIIPISWTDGGLPHLDPSNTVEVRPLTAVERARQVSPNQLHQNHDNGHNAQRQ